MSLKSSVGFLAVIRFFMVMLLTGIWIGAEHLLCSSIFHTDVSSSVPDVPSIFLNALQFIPRIGDFLGLLTSGFGIHAAVPDLYQTTLLFEVIYTLLLTFQFILMNRLANGLLGLLNLQHDSTSFIDKLVCVLNMLAIVVSSILSTNLLCTALGKYRIEKYYFLIISAVILGLILILFVFAKNKKPLDAIGDLLISLLSVALIYLMVMSGYCLSNAAYLITSELLASVTCFIFSLLAVTLLGAKLFSHSFLL